MDERPNARADTVRGQSQQNPEGFGCRNGLSE